MRFQRVLILVFIGWYLFLAFGHYFNQRPLWNDELCVLSNIIRFKSGTLFTHPLIHNQAFPRLYLWTIQQFSEPFNKNPLTLRLFSLVAMLVAFFVWIKLARRTLSHTWDFILFIFCWSASMPLVYYAAELKQYSMDVLVSGLIVLFLFGQEQIRNNPNVYRLILFFLPFLGFWSYPAIFLLLLPLYNLIRDCFDQRRWLPEILFFLTGCILMLCLVYLFDFRVSIPQLLEENWHDNFISVHSLKDFFGTFGKGMNNLIAREFAESPRWVKVPSRIFIGWGVGFMLVTFWRQFKKDRFVLCSIVPIAFTMFLIQLILAILRVFPFAVPRMSLFFYPLLILMTILAMRFINQYQKGLGVFIRIIFAGYLVFVTLGIGWDVYIRGDLGAESTLYATVR